MKILARVDIGDENIIRTWDLENDKLIIQRFDSKIVVDSKILAIPLEKSRISLVNPGEIIQQLAGVPKQEEHYEAVRESIELVYLGSLKMSDAVLIPPENSN